MRIASIIFAAAILGACHEQSVEKSSMACRDEAGREEAAIFVRDCSLYSPATHPPCNEANPCWMIVKEVVRSCELPLPGGPDPEICARYKDLQKRYPPQAG